MGGGFGPRISDGEEKNHTLLVNRSRGGRVSQPGTGSSLGKRSFLSITRKKEGHPTKKKGFLPDAHFPRFVRPKGKKKHQNRTLTSRATRKRKRESGEKTSPLPRFGEEPAQAGTLTPTPRKKTGDRASRTAQEKGNFPNLAVEAGNTSSSTAPGGGKEKKKMGRNREKKEKTSQYHQWGDSRSA